MKFKVTNITVLILANIGLDQLTKYWVRDGVSPGSRTEILGEFIQLMNVENTGAFLGMGSESHPTIKLIFLLILPTIVLVSVLYYMFTTTDLDRLSRLGLSCVVGGGIANLYDRFIYGSVTDFLFMDFGFVKTGIFNTADLSVTTGMILLLIASLKNRKSSPTA